MARLLLVLALLAAPAVAQEVTVTAPGLRLTGRVAGFDGTVLALDTAEGEVSVDLSVATCEGAACPNLDDPPLWRFAGDARLATIVLPALIEGYAARAGLEARRDDSGPLLRYDLSDAGGPVLAVTLRAATTTGGVADLVAGRADAALLARDLTLEEERRLRDAGRLVGEPRLRLLGRDALVAATGAGQRVGRIALPDLAMAFAGEIPSWAGLGGDDVPIRLHLGPPGSATADGVASALLASGGLVLSETVIRHPDEASLASALAADPNGLGLLPFERVGEARPLAIAGTCGLPFVPRAGAVRAGDYPLTVPLALLLPSRRPAPVVGGLNAFLAAPDAQLALRRAGLVGTEGVPMPLAEQGERLAAAIAAAGPEVSLDDLQQMVGTLGPLTRLSTTIRFEEGATPDPASRALLLQLAGEVAAGRWAGRRILLAGFTDGEGPAADNLALSRERAVAVEAALRAALGAPWPEAVGLAVAGFGEALPLGCDGEGEGPWALALNRRVEVWTD